MVERIAKIIVLAEDIRQANFARRYLICRGHHPRTIVVRRAPPGQGSGEQYVREQYPIEVAYYRRRAHFRKAALLAAIDADTGTVEEHEQYLDSALTRAKEMKRQADEAIALLIPKRNIETWVLCLAGQPVDEVTNYRNRDEIDELIKPAADTFYQWSRSGAALPGTCVPSLRKGVVEVRRLDQA